MQFQKEQSSHCKAAMAACKYLWKSHSKKTEYSICEKEVPMKSLEVNSIEVCILCLCNREEYRFITIFCKLLIIISY